MRYDLVLAGGLYVAMALVMVFWGNHHVDEGYYHLIARMTAEGSLPYRDYIYVQTPLYPFVYAPFLKLFGHSLIMARTCSLLLGFCSFLLAVRVARNIGGNAAAICTAALILVQPFTVYYLTIVKLYAMTSLLLTLLVYLLTTTLPPTLRYSLAAMIAALAICTRLTVLPALPLVIVIALFRTRGRERIVTGLSASLCGIIVMLAILLPFQVLSPDTFSYSVLGYHMDKEGFSGFRQIIHRLDGIFRLSELYPVFGAILFASIIIRLSQRRTGRGDLVGNLPAGAVDAACLMAGIVLFHFTSEVPYIHRYLAMTVPAVAAILGPEAMRLIRMADPDHVPGRAMMGALIFVMILWGFGQPEIRFRGPNPVGQLKQVASEIAMVTGPDDEILTFNNSVAVEADRRVLPGDEMNVLTYHPAWDRERCRTFRILNLEMLEEALVSERLRAVLVTKYSFLGNFPTFFNPGETGARPAIMYAIEKHYRRVRVFPGFGYLGEDAELYLPLDGNPRSDDSEFGSERPVQIYRYDGDDKP